jgi:serine/threonine protein kinase
VAAEEMLERVGPYRLQSRIGAGGMGEVFLALAPEGQTVAVKLLHAGGDAADAARLRREAATVRRVRGPYVAEVLDTGQVGDRPYVVTRYVQGRPLDTVVGADGPLRGSALDRLAQGLALAIDAVHAAGVVHRDLKPPNVMLVDGRPVLIDFGIAYAAAATRVTETGAMVGTVGYIAPEVLRDEPAGAPADVFGWAATVTYAATGRPAFGTGSIERIFARVLRGDVDLTDVPSRLRPLVTAAFATDPARRPTAAELVTRLAAGPVEALDVLDDPRVAAALDDPDAVRTRPTALAATAASASSSPARSSSPRWPRC